MHDNDGSSCSRSRDTKHFPGTRKEHAGLLTCRHIVEWCHYASNTKWKPLLSNELGKCNATGGTDSPKAIIGENGVLSHNPQHGADFLFSRANRLPYCSKDECPHIFHIAS